MCLVVYELIQLTTYLPYAVHVTSGSVLRLQFSSKQVFLGEVKMDRAYGVQELEEMFGYIPFPSCRGVTLTSIFCIEGE